MADNRQYVMGRRCQVKNVVISNIFQVQNHRVKSLIFYQTGVLLSMDYSLFKKDIFQVYEFGEKCCE